MANYEVSGQVRPRDATNNRADSASPNPKLSGKCRLLTPRARVACANLRNLHRAQDIAVMLLALPIDGTTFLGAVASVVTLCAQKQMIRVAAGAHVAAVQDAQSFGDRTATKREHQSMNTVDAPPRAPMAIARVGDNTRPNPAPARIHADPSRQFLQKRRFLLAQATTQLQPARVTTLVIGRIERFAREAFFALAAGERGKLGAHRNLLTVSVPHRGRSQRRPVSSCPNYTIGES